MGDASEPYVMESKPAVFDFQRAVRLFARSPDLVRRLEKERSLFRLAPDQLFHPPVPCDGAVRRGKLRVSEVLPDGSEVTRGVLQAGVVFSTRYQHEGDIVDPTPIASSPPPSRAAAAPTPPPQGYQLDSVILMALGETELWLLPAGRLDREG